MSLFITVIAVTLIVSAFCSLFEATLYSTRTATLEAARAQGRHARGAEAFLAMKRNISRPTSAILVLNTIANTAGAAFAGMLAARLYGASAVPVFSALLTLAILMLSEILPKTYGAVQWRHLWPVIVWPLSAMQRVLSPLVWLTEKVSSLVTRGSSAPQTTESEILAMIHLGAKSGEVSPTELALLTAVFPFDETAVREIMIPRHEVVTLDVGLSFAQCLQAVRETGHTRYPLCRGSLEDTLGTIHVKDLVGADPREPIDLASLARPVERHPDTTPIRQVLREMQASQRHFSLVVDELGTVVGAVTLENVIEQLIGTVQDEFDAEPAQLLTEAPGVYTVQGAFPLSLLNRALDARLGHPGVYTLSGLLAAKLGRVPRVGDKVRLDDLEAEVLAVDRHRATNVRVVPLLVDGAVAGDSSAAGNG